MSSNDQQLKTYREPNGTTTRIGQQEAGKWEAGAGAPLSSQRPWESFDDSAAREEAYKHAKKQSGET